MSEKVTRFPREETLLFMAILTFAGGYMNAYSYFTRGGAFVTFHTGNLARVGLSAYLGDLNMFISCAVPIAGCLLGSILAQFLKVSCKKNHAELFWQRTTLFAEVATLLVVGLLPAAVPNGAVNFALAVVSTFQLSNFRKYETAIHNSTIHTGNLRTLGQYIADSLIQRNRKVVIKAMRYLLLVLSFPLGLFVGGYASAWLGTYSLLLCCVPVAYAALGCLRKEEEGASN